ncbi:MAG TPA: TPM domain-containing protein, partial [Longimicrobium sp.]
MALAAALAVAACWPVADDPLPGDPSAFSATGEVRAHATYGWVIQVPPSEVYVPASLPAAFRQDGLRVYFTAIPAPGPVYRSAAGLWWSCGTSSASRRIPKGRRRLKHRPRRSASIRRPFIPLPDHKAGTMRRTLPSAVLSLALLAAAAPAPAQRYPDEPGDGVADLAGVLSPADEAGIRAVVARMRANPGVELAVLTVQSVGAYGARSPEAFATGVYNQWRLGRGQRQDGVLVLLSLDDRFTRIELGDGVPADQDARMRRIVDDVMVPRFRGGDMGGGVHDGVLAVASAFGT